MLTYSGSVRADAGEEFAAATMWFRETGEMWMMDSRISNDRDGSLYFLGDYIPQRWINCLSCGLPILFKNGGVAPYCIRLGVTGLADLYWPSGQYYGFKPPVSLHPQMEYAFTSVGISNPDWREGIVAAWTELRRVFGMPAPDETIVDDAVRVANG
jgi:hypothetical protein